MTYTRRSKREVQSTIKGAKESNNFIFTTRGRKIRAKKATFRIVKLPGGGYTALAKARRRWKEMPKIRVKGHLMKVPGKRKKVRVRGHLRKK